MKIEFLKKTFFYLLLLPMIIACDEIDPIEIPTYVPGAKGVFILNEGNWSDNDASLSFYNLETGNVTLDILGGKLGDTGQDMMIYGNKLYISVNVSSVIDVVDLTSQKSIKRIPLFDDAGIPREPRYLAAWEGNVYVTTYDGYVVKMDTTRLEVAAITQVGDNPDGIAAVAGKLYVANSGGMNYMKGTPPDNTLSVVDIAQFKQEKTIKVGVNPYIVKADKEGNLYVTYRGDYNNPSVPSGIQKVDTKTGIVSDLPIFANQKFDILDNLLYFYNVVYDENWTPSGSFGVYDLKKEKLTSDKIISDGTIVNFPYTIGVNPQNKDVYISNQEFPNRAKVFVFGRDGKKKTTLDVGIGANTFVFY